MPNTPPQNPSHSPPQYHLGPILSTSIRSNGTLRQYHQYTPISAQNDFSIGRPSHTTKRRIPARNEDMKPAGQTAREEEDANGSSAAEVETERKRDVEASECRTDITEFPARYTRQGSQGSDASAATSRTLGRSEVSCPADEEGHGDTQDADEGDGDDKREESETSSRTLGRSDTSSRTLVPSDNDDEGSENGDSDSDEEMGESDDEGDAFAESYRKGSGK